MIEVVSLNPLYLSPLLASCLLDSWKCKIPFTFAFSAPTTIRLKGYAHWRAPTESNTMTFSWLLSAVPWQLPIPWPATMTAPAKSLHRATGRDVVKYNFLSWQCVQANFGVQKYFTLPWHHDNITQPITQNVFKFWTHSKESSLLAGPTMAWLAWLSI